MKEEPKKMWNTKKIILAVIAGLAGLIVLSIIGSWIYFLATFKTYHNEEEGVEISYPKTWIVKEHPMQDVIVAFLTPKDNALDTFFENVNLSKYDMSKLPHSTEDYAKIMVDQLLMLFEDLQMTEKTPFLIAGQNGYRMVLRITGEEEKTIIVYAFTLGTMGYNILYVGSNEHLPKHRPLLDMMALTLKVRYLPI